MKDAVWLGVLSWALALNGCGFPRPRDLAGPDADLADAPSAPRCNPKADFGEAIPLLQIHSHNDESASLSADELTIYFSSDRSGRGDFDIFQATRESISMPFSNVVEVTGVNTDGDERRPTLTTDGLSLFARSQANASSPIRITLASRTSATLAFSKLEVVATVNGTTNDSDPYILPTGDALYLTSDRAGNFSLYRSAKRLKMFMDPTIVSGVNFDTSDTEATPVASPDELTLYFGSNHSDGAGSYDMYVATRVNTADGFGAPVPLANLNTAEFEVPNWISADDCVLYFTRTGADHKNLIFVTSRSK